MPSKAAAQAFPVGNNVVTISTDAGFAGNGDTDYTSTFILAANTRTTASITVSGVAPGTVDLRCYASPNNPPGGSQVGADIFDAHLTDSLNLTTYWTIPAPGNYAMQCSAYYKGIPVYGGGVVQTSTIYFTAQ